MKYSVITNCSSRKRDIGVAPLVPTLSLTDSISDLASSWLQQVHGSQIRVESSNLYQGRSIAECRMVSRTTAAEFFIVSAGLGLVHSDDLVPSYSLTISEGTGSIHKWLSAQGLGSTDWWRSLNQASGSPYPISKMINAQTATSMHLIALPSSYLEMIAPDLALVRDSQLQTLRLFTSVAGSKALSTRLQSTVMPYDERLEGIINHNGTRSDFPQRALKHFVTVLKGHELPLSVAKERVVKCMTEAIKPPVPRREKVTNERISELIRNNWNSQEGSAYKLLRFLRDEAKVACEQSRFSGIWRTIKEEKSRV